jgi:hypothetical protein
MLGFAQQEGTGRGGHTWWMLVAGEGPDEDLARGEGGAARPVLAARKGKATRRERETTALEKKIQKEVTG